MMDVIWWILAGFGVGAPVYLAAHVVAAEGPEGLAGLVPGLDEPTPAGWGRSLLVLGWIVLGVWWLLLAVWALGWVAYWVTVAAAVGVIVVAVVVPKEPGTPWALGWGEALSWAAIVLTLLLVVGAVLGIGAVSLP